MKAAISLPDDLFTAIDARARVLKISRSGLIAAAAREYLAREGTEDATAAWNRVIDEAGQPGDEPAARAFARRTKAVVSEANRKEKGRRSRKAR